MAANPIDGKLYYLCIDETDRSRYSSLNISELSIYYLDTEKKSLIRWFEKGDRREPSFDHSGNLCFDSEGNLYVVVPSHPHEHADRADTWSDCFEVTRITPNKDVGEFEVDTQVTVPRKGDFTNGFVRFDNASNKLIFAGMCNYEWYHDGIVLSVDTIIKERTQKEKVYRTYIERKKFETVAYLNHWLRDGKEVGGAGDIESYGVSGLDVAKGEYYVSIAFGFSYRQCSNYGRIFRITPV